MSKRTRETRDGAQELVEHEGPRVTDFLDIEAAEDREEDEEEVDSEVEDDFIVDDGDDVGTEVGSEPGTSKPPRTRMSSVVRYRRYADEDAGLMEHEADTYRLCSRRWKKERDEERERVRAESCNGRKMWMVRSFPRNTHQLARRIDDRLKDDRPSRAFAIDSLPGRVYVVASNPSQRSKACTGIMGLYARSALLLPKEEQAKVEGIYSHAKEAQEYKPGEWVDIVRGQYRRSTGRVRTISDNTDEVVVAIVPYNLCTGTRTLFTLDHARSLQHVGSDHKLIVEIDHATQGAFKWDGLNFRKGLLELRLPATHHIRKRTCPPSVFEVGDFTEMESYEDMVRLSGPEPLIRSGDNVRVIWGELRGVEGIVHESDATTVRMKACRLKDRPFDYGSSKPLSATVWEVQRIIQPGDNVRKRFGPLAGVFGLVVTVEGETVTLYSLEKHRCFTECACWLETYEPDVSMVAGWVPEQPIQPKVRADPYIGARIFCRGHRQYKGRVGYVRTVNRNLHTAEVSIDGQSVAILAKIEFQHLIAVDYKMCLDGVPLSPLELAHYNYIFKTMARSNSRDQSIVRATTPPPDGNLDEETDPFEGPKNFDASGMWVVHELVMPYLSAYKVWFSYDAYPSSPCFTIRDSIVSHAKCDARHADCQLLVKYKTGGGRGSFRVERVRVRTLSPKIPKTKGLALVVRGQRCGTLTTVKRQEKSQGRATGCTVMLDDSGEEWYESFDNITKVEPCDASGESDI